MIKNKNLHKAKKEKNDEFYTQLADIERECYKYKDLFKDKIIYCNCDDARESNFFKYFSMNFEFFGLKKLITTGYKANGHGVAFIYEGDKNGNKIVDDEEIQVITLEGDGDFKSPECIEFLKQADIVVTNPPFSLFREYVAQLINYNKKFLIIGSQNAITYKEIFSYIKNNKMWLGTQSVKEFITPLKTITEKTQYCNDQGQIIQKFGNICWFTNLPHNKRNENIDLYKKYNKNDYPTYDNYDAIEVSKVADIPMDYDGVMGVPITFLDKYNPNQFEILSSNDYRKSDSVPFKAHGLIKDKDGAINGKPTYARILIRRK